MDRRHRLTSSRDFALAMREGRRGAAGAIACAVRERGDEEAARIGVAVGRVAGTAVRRNRAKRLLREAVRTLLPSIPAGRDVVLAARAGVFSKNFQEIRHDVVRALERAGVPAGAASC